MFGHKWRLLTGSVVHNQQWPELLRFVKDCVDKLVMNNVFSMCGDLEI